jgi:hypothetical protein
VNSWLVILLIFAALVLLNILAVRKGWFTNPRGSFTGITVYHDWVNKDAQRGTEVIIKRNAGDKEPEDESGEPTFTPE